MSETKSIDSIKIAKADGTQEVFGLNLEKNAKTYTDNAVASAKTQMNKNLASASAELVRYTNEKVAGVNVPTKTSQLTNDSGFVTSVPTKTSDLTNDSGYTSVVANPTVPSGTTPSQLENIKIGDTIYSAPSGSSGGGSSVTKVSELTNDSGFITSEPVSDSDEYPTLVLGTKVEANPTLSGSETELSGIKIGDTKYAMPSGGGGATLYEHNIQITNYTSYVCIKLVNNKIIMTISDLYNYLASLNPTGGSENRIPIVCTGVIKDSNYWIVVSGIYTVNGTSSPQAVSFFGYEKNNYKWYSSSMNISGWDLIDTVYDMEGNLV